MNRPLSEHRAPQVINSRSSTRPAAARTTREHQPKVLAPAVNCPAKRDSTACDHEPTALDAANSARICTKCKAFV